VEDGASQAVHVTMNQPLRHRGYTFYQSSYDGPLQGSDGRTVWVSVFSVVRNPADRVPILACAVIAFGLLLHMGLKLANFLTAQARRPA